jgi:hypothetical protein
MVNSDFAVITFDEHLGDVQFDIKTTYPFMGSMSSIKTFDILGSPINGYIITKTQDMYLPNHLIIINGRELPVMASNNYESRLQ